MQKALQRLSVATYIFYTANFVAYNFSLCLNHNLTRSFDVSSTAKQNLLLECYSLICTDQYYLANDNVYAFLHFMY